MARTVVGTESVEPGSRKTRGIRSEGAYRLFLLLLLVGVALLFFSGQHSGPKTGSLAPDFALPLVSGGTGQFRLAELRGKPVVVEVFASWCGVCRRSAPTVAAAALAPRKREVRFLGVSVDQSADEALGVARQWGIPYAVAFDDGQFAKSWGITVLPTFVLIDGDGRVRHASTGAPDRKELESWLAEVGAETL